MANMTRYTPAEITRKLKEGATLTAEGRTQKDVARALGISVMSYHRWRKKAKSAQMHARPADRPISNPAVTAEDLSESQRRTRIEELQVENTRLRKLVTDLLLEKMRLEDEARPLPSQTSNQRSSG